MVSMYFSMAAPGCLCLRIPAVSMFTIVPMAGAMAGASAGILVSLGVTVNVLVILCTGLYIGENSCALALIVPRHGDGHDLILGQHSYDVFVFQDLIERVFVIQIFQIQRSCQPFSVLIISVHGNHPVESVEPQPHRGVDFDTDRDSRSKIEPKARSGDYKHGQQACG